MLRIDTKVLRTRPVRTGIVLFLACSLFSPSSVSALSLDLHHGNVYYARSDKFDTLSHRDNFYEDLGFSLQNPGSSSLSFSSDIGIVNNKISGMPSQYEIRSSTLDYSSEKLGLGASVGRQFVNNFTRDAGYLDGLSVGYDLGKLLSLSGFAGMTIPSLYTDSIINPGIIHLDSKALTAGFFGNVRIMQHTEFGIGASADEQIGNDRLVRAAASLSSKLAKNIDLRGNIRYELTDHALEIYNLSGRFFPSDMVMIGAHVAGQAKIIDSVNYYERMIFNTYNEAGLSFGFYPAKNVSVIGNYGIRIFHNDSLDNLADLYLLFKGLSLRASLGSGAHGTNYEVMPGYTFSWAQIASVGLTFQVNHYKYIFEQPFVWRDAYTVVGFMRWFVPWFTPAINLVVEPQVEYMVNDYYKQDVRVLFISHLNFHRFWRSGPGAQ